jgi:hypothetical protein
VPCDPGRGERNRAVVAVQEPQSPNERVELSHRLHAPGGGGWERGEFDVFGPKPLLLVRAQQPVDYSGLVVLRYMRMRVRVRNYVT